MTNFKTAAILIIGNEILSGRTHDKNGNYIAQKLTEHGVNTKEIRVVPDDEGEIIIALNFLREKYDYIFTTGGIGPTHDDITAECVTKAFGEELVVHDGAWESLLRHYGEENFNEARQKMAHMPPSASLIDNPVSGAPGFNIGNVYVMAGVPKIMHAMLDNILPVLKGGDKIKSVTITTNLTEGIISKSLEEIQNAYPNVDIGCYPYFHKDDFGVSIVLRDFDESTLNEASSDITKMLNDLGADKTKTKIVKG